MSPSAEKFGSTPGIFSGAQEPLVPWPKAAAFWGRHSRFFFGLSQQQDVRPDMAVHTIPSKSSVCRPGRSQCISMCVSCK